MSDLTKNVIVSNDAKRNADPIKSKQHAFYQTKQWKDIRKIVKNRDDENYDDNQEISWYNAPLSQSVIYWYRNDNDNWYICNIYINSKALGVDLVEVVE